jgi:hypothetical protein
MQPMEEVLRELVDAIDRKWSLETERRRANAISPAVDAALIRARDLLGIEAVHDIEAYRKRFHKD